MDVNSIDWVKYPLVAQHSLARTLLIIEASLGHSHNTIDAYARGREDFFTFCMGRSIAPELATKEHIVLWVRDLTLRPNHRGKNIIAMDSGTGLSNSTLQQKITAVRLFFDFVIEKGCRTDNPVGRGRYTPGRGFAGQRDRALIPRYRKLPWIPNDGQWQCILRAASAEPLRNRAMLSLSYDAALRREEVCSLLISDFDFANRMLTVRCEITKGRRTRIVPFSTVTTTLLAAYLRHRRKLTLSSGSMFLSESPRNRTEPLKIWTWSKVAERLAKLSCVSGFTTHTLRHLCLTDLARSGWDIHEIAIFAGHQSLKTTMEYIHLSGRDLALKLERGMDQIHKWRLSVIAEALK